MYSVPVLQLPCLAALQGPTGTLPSLAPLTGPDTEIDELLPASVHTRQTA